MSSPTVLEQEVAVRLLEGSIPLEPLTPEASVRRYFRPLDARARGWLVVRGSDPAPHATARWLRAAGVRVPEIGPERLGAYLVEDLGERHLFHEPVLEHYTHVLRASERIGAAILPPRHPNALMALDAGLFEKELRMFREFYVQAFRRRAWSPAAADQIDAACRELACSAAQGPWRVQHRDYHSRNLLLPGSGVAVLDHQDLRPGPLFYDLASLRTDAYVDLPAPVSERLAAEVAALGARHGLGADESRRRYDATALQRVLKALGTFGRMLAALGRTEDRGAEQRARRHALELLDRTGLAPILREWVA